jgi:hypothetical protein
MAGLLAQMDAEWARLREIVRGGDDASLARRPPSGKWSVQENVRHLVFAELAHHSHILPGGDEWRTMLLSPRDLAVQPRQKMVGSETTTVAEALEVWEPLHRSVQAALMAHDTADARYGLGRHIKHQQQHVDEVARLLRHARREKQSSGSGSQGRSALHRGMT